MTFNERIIKEFKDFNPFFSFQEEERLKQALIDKEQEVLKRVYGCLNVSTLDLDAVASFITITRNEIKDNLDKEFKQ